MVTGITLENFKSHRKTEVSLSNLNVLCGTNGVGKSSVIHALLLLRESFFVNDQFAYLDFKSNPVNVGTGKDALYQFSDKNEITFRLNIDHQEFMFSFSSGDADLTKTVMYQAPAANHLYDRAQLSQQSLFGKSCQFISAGRMGPQPSYPKDDVVVEVYNQISVIAGRAEHFVHFLSSKRDLDVIPELRSPLTLSSDLLSQTTAWEAEISEGIDIVIQDYGNLGYELRYQFQTGTNRGKTDDIKAENVGFGVTYVMPIIVAILSAQPGTLLFIENPEAHLHPTGQAKLTELICLASQAGVQIILETHSDHIINGILVQCKKFETEGKGIDRECTRIYYFKRDQDEHKTICKAVPIEEDGKIIYPPTGFFDQFQIDRNFLMGF
ncbi:MAG: DUF3696 domain-containing protein [Sphingobacteriales bacterium]|nr:MAG: DUF3696 domain-containing protein [Sphingobacteriales bacterium]